MPPEALSLGFDTSAAHCAAALLSGDTVLADVWEPMDTGQAERLFPLLQGLLADVGIGWRDLTVIGVGTGPGNFTGVRIAVAAARGLSLSLAIPAVGVNAFEARAVFAPRPVIVSLDARRGQIWLTTMGHEAPPRLCAVDTLPADLAESGLPVLGYHAEGIAALTGGPVWPAAPLTPGIARIASARRGDGLPRPAPLYLRAPNAAPPADLPPRILP